ncbi:unnamed protein product [Moneuplotes crassus]|uniref:non-specific serine/threonine protein kinase n=1 Tax=Euplotes crassus TaxID=5936 RepID=A0AAD1Y1F1_EUPCR|nr:unnamed protein product [Moneuplotes crassus]
MSIADYEIISVLGKGSYSIVYKVLHKATKQLYAMKKVKIGNLTQKERENSLNEVDILNSINHPNIITCHETFTDKSDKSLCIVMEYADSGDAYQLMCNLRDNNKMFTEEEIWRILIQTTKGLKKLHDQGIMHRDLKSANIFLFSNGQVKLGDLNVSKVMKNNMEFTQTGTPYYASPEVWKDQPYDYKSDMWSLGCAMYELICQKPPFDASSMDLLYKSVIQGYFDPIPLSYSSGLEKIIRSMIRVVAERRPSCKEILCNKITKKWTSRIITNSKKKLVVSRNTKTTISPQKEQVVNPLQINLHSRSEAPRDRSPDEDTSFRDNSEINETRREQIDAYSSLGKHSNKNVLNVSLKKSRFELIKNNLEYLEVDISESLDHEVNKSYSNKIKKISMKRKLGRIPSLDYQSSHSRKNSKSINAYLDSTKNYIPKPVLQNSIKDEMVHFIPKFSSSKKLELENSISITSSQLKNLPLSKNISKPKNCQKKLPIIQNFDKIHHLQRSPAKDLNPSTRSKSLVKSSYHEHIVDKISSHKRKLRRKIKEHQLPYINHNRKIHKMENLSLSRANRSYGRRDLFESNDSTSSHISTNERIQLQNSSSRVRSNSKKLNLLDSTILHSNKGKNLIIINKDLSLKLNSSSNTSTRNQP